MGRRALGEAAEEEGHCAGRQAADAEALQGAGDWDGCCEQSAECRERRCIICVRACPSPSLFFLFPRLLLAQVFM